MSEKHHPTTKDLQDLAMVMRTFAETCDEAIQKMNEKHVSQLPIDNWDTAIRGLDYVDKAMRAISSAYVLGKATPVVRELLATYKSQKKAAELAETKKQARETTVTCGRGLQSLIHNATSRSESWPGTRTIRLVFMFNNKTTCMVRAHAMA